MTFEDKIIQSTVEKLLKGIDYREESSHNQCYSINRRKIKEMMR